MSKLIISTGGTGGHIVPAMAIAEEFRDRAEEFYILLVGPKVHFKHLERFPLKVYPKKDRLSLAFYTLRVSRRIAKASSLVAFGSYASFPSLFWAYILNKPYFIVELNVIPGRITRMFSSRAKAIFTAFEETSEYLGNANVVHTGVPIRKYEKIRKEEAKSILKIPKDRKTVLVFGGSQGSFKLNRLTLEIAKLRTDLEFILVAGRTYRYLMRNVEIPRNVKLFEFFEDMSLVYSASDVAVSRAGGGAIGELLYFKIPALLVPYPFAKDNHQFYNAKAVSERGAFIMLEEENLTFDSFLEKFDELLERREDLKRGIMRIRKEDARERIADIVQGHLAQVE